MKVSVFFLAHFLEEQQEKQKEIHIYKKETKQKQRKIYLTLSLLLNK
jgi:hypothetical protein